MSNRSKLLKLRVINVGCIGPDGVEIALDNIVCLVGKNNAGKSTILRAYELAHTPGKFTPALDRCRFAPDGEPSVVELDVHIPVGIGNVDEDWKIIEGDLRVVRSRWEWTAGGSALRKTWSPQAGEWAEEGKAGGADNVFKSRLPKPLRIGSLEDVGKTEELLLTLALSPFVEEVAAQQKNPDSELSKVIISLKGLVDGLSKPHEARFDEIASQVQTGFAGVFPGLGIRLNVAMAAPSLKIADLMQTGSGIHVQDGDIETSLAQQGTGARRALFWSMLQVHNQISRRAGLKSDLEKSLAKAEADLEKAKTETAKTKATEAKVKFQEQLDKLEAGDRDLGADDPAFPGYLLLMDEPENALHPLAARAAQRHLYKLAADPEWQVMLTTHSPYFVNPLADHTTIIRLARAEGEAGELTRKTYRSDAITFDPETKRNLQALQQMDVGFAEIFFGAYPILVEGDTEYAAYLAAIVEANHVLLDKIAIVRARGKAILPGLMRMLRHFQVPFSVIHDVDWPFTNDGAKRNGMWAINQTIFDEAQSCRADGVAVRHRVSIPDFERLLGGEELGKDKPLSAYLRTKDGDDISGSIQNVLTDLFEGKEDHPFGYSPDVDGDFLAFLLSALEAWCQDHRVDAGPRLIGKLLQDDQEAVELTAQ